MFPDDMVEGKTRTEGQSPKGGSLRYILALFLCSVAGVSLWSGNAFAQSVKPAPGTVAQAVTTDPIAANIRLDTADLAIPAAEEIIVDLPSALHASRYQQGETNGLRYVLFPDGSGKIMQAYDLRSVLYRIKCSAGVSCTITAAAGQMIVVPAVGGPKPSMPASPDGLALSRYLAEWLLAGTGTPPATVIAAASAEPEAQETESLDTQTAVADSQEQEAPTAEEVTVDVAQAQATSSVGPVKEITAETCIASDASCGVATEPLPKEQVVARNAHKSAHRLISPTPKRRIEKRKTTKQAPQKAAPVATRVERETLFQRLKLSCSITGSITLRYKNHSSGSERFGKPRANFGCGAKLTDKLSLRLSILGYADKNEKSPSDAEFTYSLSYRATDKLSFSYSNYSARFDNSGSAFVDSLKSGSLRASYKLPKIKLPNEKTIGCSTSISLIRPKDSTVNLSCSYAVTDRLRISGTAYAYFAGRQNSWDPDFAYTASYKINKDWNITYSNYANNRFFWNKTSSKTRGILGGTVSVSYKFKF